MRKSARRASLRRPRAPVLGDVSSSLILEVVDDVVPETVHLGSFGTSERQGEQRHTVSRVEQRISIVTLGVRDLARSLRFYGMFASTFVKVARKELDEVTSTPPPAFDANNLERGWRTRLADDLDALAEAWSIEDAWQGNTWVGGMHMPAEVVGVVALDELVIHGWDLSVATGQPYDPAAQEVEAAIEFVSNFDAPRDGRLFGPIVDIPLDAPLFDRLLGLTGRDPTWRPPV